MSGSGGQNWVADHHYARARSWPELHAAHARFFADDNGLPHFAHQARALDRQSPAAVLGWAQGAWRDPADFDRLFRLRAHLTLGSWHLGTHRRRDHARQGWRRSRHPISSCDELLTAFLQPGEAADTARPATGIDRRAGSDRH
jgi:hypothetical protein